MVNSLTHFQGSRRFATRDDSRNHGLVAFLTFGEGWHNNHHAHPTLARHGLAWWELDITWISIWTLRRLGIARAVRVAPACPIREYLLFYSAPRSRCDRMSSKKRRHGYVHVAPHRSRFVRRCDACRRFSLRTRCEKRSRRLTRKLWRQRGRRNQWTTWMRSTGLSTRVIGKASPRPGPADMAGSPEVFIRKQLVPIPSRAID